MYLISYQLPSPFKKDLSKIEKNDLVLRRIKFLKMMDKNGIRISRNLYAVKEEDLSKVKAEFKILYPKIEMLVVGVAFPNIINRKKREKQIRNKKRIDELIRQGEYYQTKELIKKLDVEDRVNFIIKKNKLKYG